MSPYRRRSEPEPSPSRARPRSWLSTKSARGFIDHWRQRCADIRRLSVAYAAWLVGHDPTRRVCVVSYPNELAAELHRQFRIVIDAPWYQALFPTTPPAKDTGTELVTTAGGSRYAASVGGTLTGRGTDLIIVDDPLKAEEAMSEPGPQAGDWLVCRHPGALLVRRVADGIELRGGPTLD
jgi:hypothetical protein